MYSNENPNEASCATQNQRILEYLNQGKTVTALESVKLFGCLRLASRIHDIKENLGIDNDIKKVRVKDISTKKHFDAYYRESAIFDNYNTKDAEKTAYAITMARLNGYRE